jgi:hypothetical protein
MPQRTTLPRVCTKLMTLYYYNFWRNLFLIVTVLSSMQLVRQPTRFFIPPEQNVFGALGLSHTACPHRGISHLAMLTFGAQNDEKRELRQGWTVDVGELQMTCSRYRTADLDCRVYKEPHTGVSMACHTFSNINRKEAKSLYNFHLIFVNGNKLYL